MTLTSFPQKRPFLFSLLSFTVGFTATLLCAELFFRCLPTSESRHPYPVNQANPILHFETNRDFLYSKGWNFSIIAKKHSNNYGFLNDSNYIKKSVKPLVAVIGDSFVEAKQVENQKAMHGILANFLKPKCRVYSFGASGAPLSQYLAYAEYAQNEFRASRMIFIIVGNDFDESLVKYRGRHAFHYFTEPLNDPSKKMELNLIDYHPSKKSLLLRKSALYRYFSLNLGIKQFLKKRKRYSAETQKRMFAGNTLALAERERVKDSKLVVETFFYQLPMRTGLLPKNILFLIDGIRPHLYSVWDLQEAKKSYFSIMRDFFMKYAGSKGYEVIDMQHIFRAHYEQNGVKFEFKNDGHWNELAHQIVARSINTSTLISHLGCT